MRSGEAEDVVVRLTGDVGDDDRVSVFFDPGDSGLMIMPTTITLTGVERETTVTVVAGLAATIGDAIVRPVIDSMSSGVQVDTDPLNAVIMRRVITVSFETSSIELVRGGTAMPAEASVIVTVSTEPLLRETEEIEMEFMAPVGLQVPPVILDRDVQSSEVTVTATADGPFSGRVTAREGGGTNLGNATLEFADALSVDVVRRVDAVFEADGESTTLITRKAGDIEITVTTSPRLTRNEQVTLMLSGGVSDFEVNVAQVTLNEEQPAKSVTVRASVPGRTGTLTAKEAAGVEQGARVTSNLLTLAAIESDSVKVLFSPSTLTVQVGRTGNTVIVGTFPELSRDQQVMVALDVGSIAGVEVTAVSGRPSKSTSRAIVMLEQSTPMDTVMLTAGENVVEGEYEVSVETTSGVTVAIEPPQPRFFVRVVSALFFRIRVFLEGVLQ